MNRPTGLQAITFKTQASHFVPKQCHRNGRTATTAGNVKQSKK
jgi:hypothetical protein